MAVPLEDRKALYEDKKREYQEYLDKNKPTQWADAAYQLRQLNKLRQEYYDKVMAAPLEDRKAVYGAIKREHVKKGNPTYWADQAYQLGGGNQTYYDEVMEADLDERKAVYGYLKRKHSKD